MVLQVLYELSTRIVPPGYYIHAAIAVLTLVIIYAFSQGRTTNRDRDLHARTIVITGAFSPLGMTLVSSLASRGAHIIAVSPYPLSHPQPTLLIPALRAATNNESIFAEYADLSSPKSIREFCTRFLTGDDQRLDAIIFAHEYRGIGSFFGSTASQEAKRESDTLASFLLTTLLLPAVLVAPVERDIRIINLVNPFYAAALPSFTSTLLNSLSAKSESTSVARSVFVSEGHRALRTTIFTRHLQRILNALPNRAPTFDQPGLPGASPAAQPETPNTVPTEETGKKPPRFPSNIVAVTVCPGVSRVETISTLLGGEREHDPEGYSTLGHILCFVLFPLIWLFFKSSTMAMQSILHTLFLPTPFKRALAHAHAAMDSENPAVESTQKGGKELIGDMFTEVVKPGALYRECSVVTLTLPPLPTPESAEKNAPNAKDDGTSKGKSKASRKETSEDVGEEIEIEDDGEYGGESMGRVVWEWYEKKIKTWEATEERVEETQASETTEESSEISKESHEPAKESPENAKESS